MHYSYTGELEGCWLDLEAGVPGKGTLKKP